LLDASIWRKAEKSFAHGSKPDIALRVFLDIEDARLVANA
jgi:hypothetical protein